MVIMKKLYLLMILLCLTGPAIFAQYTANSKYFVYLQTEPAQPFYIKISGQQLSANASGYLILPQLKDGDYKMVVGFPQSKFPEQTYNFKIDSKDKGYLIKDFGAEGWGLFDLQTMAISKPVSPATEAVAINNTPKKEPVKQAENVSDFTKVLSKAANDPAILEEKPKPALVEEKPAPVPEPVKEEIVKQKEATQPKQQEAVAVIQKPKPAPAGIVKISQSETGEGVNAVYEERLDNGTAEQIAILIPAEKKPQPVVETTPVVEQKPIAQANEEKKFEVEEKPAITQEPATNMQETAAIVAPTGNCKKIATEDDFLRLRRSMAQRDNDDQMIAEANRAFKSRCYTTAQIKYLSSMFLSNAGKYNFYVAAHSHVADADSFSSLRSEIKDAYYLGKFDALLGQ